jgi:hypothetical protein
MPLVFPDQAAQAATRPASDAAQAAAQGVTPQAQQPAQPAGRLVFPRELSLRDAGSIAADMGTALWEGAKNTGRMLGATGNTVGGNLSGVDELARSQAAAEAQSPDAKALLMQEIQRRKAANPDAGWLDVIKNVGASFIGQPEGAAQFVAEQTPNTAVSLGAGIAGAKGGAALGSLIMPGVGTAVGGVAGFLGGMFLGNASLEIGGKAMEKSQDQARTGGSLTADDASAAIREGSVKGGVITAVDAATLGAGRGVARLFNKTAIEAGARAEARVLADAGVDVTSRAAIERSLAADPVLRATAQEAGKVAAQSASKIGSRAATGGTLLGMETVGEGAGEYLGELAATGKADKYDAVMEAMAGLSQSVPETAWSMRQSQGNDLSARGIERVGGDLPPAAPAPAPSEPPAPPAPPTPPAAPNNTIIPPADVPPLDPTALPPDLDAQNRDRTRSASVLQMQKIAQNPDYLRAGPSRSPDTGAPMVFAQGDDTSLFPSFTRGREDVAVMSDGQRVPFQYAVVDASLLQPSNFADGTPNPLFNNETPGLVKALSNARSAGLRAAWAQGTASGYAADLEADTKQHGISVEAIRSTSNPVLVRLYSQSSNTPGMAARSQGQGLGMSPGELARQDAPLIDGGLLAVWQGGDVADARNLDFVRGFVGRLQGTGQDLAGMMTQAGTLSPDGRKRIQAALAQSAYGDSDLIAEMFDSTDTDIKAIGEALKLAAPEWADMRDSARSGAIDPAADITPALLDAVAMVRRARQQRQSLSDLARQTDITTGQTPDPMVLGALRLLYGGEYLTRPMGRDRMADFLREYTRLAKGITADAGLFGDAPAPLDVLTALTKETATDGQQQQPGAAAGTTQQPGAGLQQPNGGSNPGGDAGPGGAAAVRPGDNAGGAQPAAGGAGPLANTDTAGQAAAQGVTAPGNQPMVGDAFDPTGWSEQENKINKKTGQPMLGSGRVRFKRADERGFEQSVVVQNGVIVTSNSVSPLVELTNSSLDFDAPVRGRVHVLNSDVQGLVLTFVPEDSSGATATKMSPRAVQQYKDGVPIEKITETEFSDAGGIKPDGSRTPHTTVGALVKGPAPGAPVSAPATTQGASDVRQEGQGRRQEEALTPEAGAPGQQPGAPAAAQTPAPAPAPRTPEAMGDALRRRIQGDVQAKRDGEAAYQSGADRIPPESMTAPSQRRMWLEGYDTAAPASSPAPAPAPTPAGGANTVFTEDAAAAARARLKAKLGRLNSGIDPETMLDGITLAGYHIERGARTFAAYARAMVDDLGDAVKPYLVSWYLAVRNDPRASDFKADMDKAGAVEDADLDALLANKGKAPEAASAVQPSLNTPAGRMALAQVIADRFIGGDGFKTIIEARKFIAEATGEKIEAGTQAAKLADEAIEMAVVMAGREIVQAARAQGRSDSVIYDRLVNLYDLQPTLGVRTSTSVREQAYSTPVPLAFLASRRAQVGPDSTVGEPTAGNTMLLIEVDPERAAVNELNADRAANARALGFTVTSHDAARHQLAPEKSLDRVVANPPFGAVKGDDGQTVVFPVASNYGTREIDHAISFKALDAMKDDGSAVLILGGVDASNEEAIREGYRSKSKREFYFRLYGLYNVVDHFTVDGGLYSKQGAGYPVDVVVIRGRGKATRAMPAAELPKRYDNWEALKKEKLDGSTEATATGVVPTGPATGTGRSDGAQGQQPGAGGLVDGAGRQGAGTGGQGAGPGRGGDVGGTVAGTPGAEGQPGRRGGAGAAQPGTADGPDAGRDGAAQAPVSGQGPRGVRGNAPGDGGNRPGDVGGTGGSQGERVESGLSDRRGLEQETETQVEYAPQSGAASVGTLVPRAMRESIAASLKRVADSVGNIDEFVAEKLNFDPETLRANFSAEQVDALALAIMSAEAGKGFIIGDQTGIGKGRVVAAMLRYAMINERIPVFVTEKPNLYADMIRDLDDIGMGDELRLQSNKPLILATNSSEPIPYVLQRKSGDTIVETEHTLRAPGAGADLEKFFDQIAGSRDIGPYKVVFTTYSQLQTVKGKVTARMRMVQSLAQGGYMVFDESHNAGGTQITQPRTKKDRDAAKAGETTTGRSGFVRSLVRVSSGSFFSSATYAKRPDVMDLYSSTNMLLAVDRPADLAPAIMQGGVPMQQIVATMLAEDGQYIRRERTFAGVTYETRPMTVDRQTAENMAQSMRMILAFSRGKEAAVKAMQKEFDREGAMVGVSGGEKTSVQGANFGAIMHNLIDQMLLSLKAKESVDFAIERLKAGEKVVLTVANTMGSFLSDYAEEFGIRPGEPVTLSFADLYQRYLEKQRVVKIKRPGGPKSGVPYRLTDSDLGSGLVAQYNDVARFIQEAGFGSAPISPIDYMHQRLREAGYKTDEITGRSVTVSYAGKAPVLASRNANIKQRLTAIRGFNSGAIDVIILNQSGATGLSLHASAKVKDQRKRRMIIVQAEKNIDTHMQMLGRVHRTGQVITPDYTQAMADIPAEARPASVLLKKMASLNANTTASRKSAVTAEGVVDFMNDYGGQVAAEFLLDNPEIHMDLGGQKVLEIPAEATEADEDLIRKLTGYIPILPIEQQEAVYRDLVDRYNDLLARENAMGTNKLEAAALDLGAKTEKREQITTKRDSPVPSRFAEPAFMEQVDVARTVKPLTKAEVQEAVSQSLGGKTPQMVANELNSSLAQRMEPFLVDLQKRRMQQGADTDGEKRAQLAQEVERHRMQQSIISDLLFRFQIGQEVSLLDQHQSVTYGVITSVSAAGKTKSPAAASGWKFTIALANGEARSITLSASQIGKQFTLRAERGPVITLNPSTNEPASMRIPDLFDAYGGSGNVRREKRWMVTGNLLAGFASYPGQILTYTKDDGSTGQGVLMRRGFDFEKRRGEAKASFPSATVIRLFFTEAGRNATIGTPDGVLRVKWYGGNYPAEFEVASSKREGGRFYLDRGLTDALGRDFTKVGQVMRAAVTEDDMMRALVYLMTERDDVKLEAQTNKDVARRLLGLPDVTESQGKRTGDRPAFSRTDAATKGMTVAGVQRVSGGAMAAWANKPRLVVARNIQEPSVPQALRDEDARQRKGGATGDVRGTFYEGVIYLFSDHLGSDKDVIETLFHEGLGHYGLRGVFGDALNAVLDMINLARPDLMRPKAAEYGADLRKPAQRRKVAEEVLASMAQSEPSLGFVRRAVAAVRTWLRTNVPGFEKLRLTDDEIIRSFILPARQFVMQGQAQAVASAAGAQAAFARASQGGPRQTPEQRAETILATPVTQARPLDRVFRTVSRMTGLEAVTNRIYGRAAYLLDRFTPETVKAGIVSDYGVPEAVIDMRVMLQGRQRQQLRRSGELVDKLASLTREESRIAYEWMNMDGSDPRAYLSMMQGLPEESVRVLQDVQRMIDDLSKEAVRLGQLDPRSYERFKFAYLRRTYERYLEELTPQQRASQQRATRILGDQYRMRGLVEPVEMAKIKSGDPEWWGRKEREGKGDTGLVNQKFIKLERLKPTGAGTIPLPGMTGRPDGKVLEVVYWPADRAVPAKYSEWRQNEVFEVRDVKGGKVILWRDFTKDEREAMGEVDEARFAIARTLQRMVHDVEVGRYLEGLSQKYAKADGDEIDGTLVEASEHWHRAFKPGDWVKVPETKITGTSVAKYGKLAGKYLPGPIWNDVRFAVNGPFQPFGEVYGKVLSAWKVAKTALTPAVHMNNVMANLVMADWHEVGAAHVGKALRIILAANQRDGKGALGSLGNVAASGGIADREAALQIMNRYRDAGGDIGSWATQEIAREQMAPLLDAVLEELGRNGDASVQGQIGVMAALQHLLHLKLPEAWSAFKASKPATVAGREAQSMIDLYQAEDDVFRLAAWLAAKERGLDDLRAGREARKSFLDYDINAPWIDAMRRSAWPFISFTYRAVPMLFEIAGKRPHKLMKLAVLVGALNMLGVAMSGDDEDEDERRRRMLPEEKAGKVWGIVPKLIRMPWDDKNGSPVYLDIRRFVPVGDIVDTGSTQAALPVPPGLMPGGPLVILGEVLMNKSAFTGKPIVLGTDTPTEVAGKVFSHLYKGFVPNLPGLPGTYATDALVNAGSGKTDAFGRQQSVAQAVASSVGVKLGSYPEDVLRRNTMARASAQEREIETVMRGLQRQRQMNAISQEEFDRKIEVQREKLRKLSQETREKVAQ